ncbi:hypothetical protein [Glutamicibacter nicotianae]|uniref:Uncharacterized protein n=1 Tax=Glutamicibacter nicotianae TaxID=37929 RepID=A0ABQ0RH28_GLUNI|nr:hypothetical protein [Glutamicibacter nicotianae]GEC11133.1 hypothetical protein ANI01nite_03360 [Glutamicibacter nicotianae]
MRNFRKFVAVASTGALTLSLLVAGALPSAAASRTTEQEVANAATLEMSVPEYKSMRELAEKGQVELWANGKKFLPNSEDSWPQSIRNLPIGKTSLYQAKTWGACGVKTANNKHVRIWYVNKTPYARLAAVLNCGTWTPKNPNGGWGYRHIAGKHGGEWKQLAAQVAFNTNWRDIADFAINDGLTNIYSSARNPANNTFRYKGKIELKWYDGRTIKTYYTTVAVDQRDRRIITAYYRSKK